MSEEETKRLDGRIPQQILIKLEVMDARLQRVEERIEQRGFDTKPIWEQALAQITEVKEDVRAVKAELGIVHRKIDVFSRDLLTVRAEQVSMDERLRNIEERN